MNYTNLNLPEATLKLLEEKGGIKCLADGIIAVENDNREDLKKVLKAAFPEAAGEPGQFPFYKKSPNESWMGYSIPMPKLKSIPASVLVKELEDKPFEWGERVWVTDCLTWHWQSAIFISDRDSLEFPYATIAKDQSIIGTWRYCQREKPKPAPLRITHQMIAEKFGVEEFEIVNEKV